MEQVHNLEKTVAEWYKNVPHLPKEFTKWLADNIWWLTVIGVVISVIGLFTIVPVALIALGLSSGIAASYGIYDTNLGNAWIGILVSLASLVVVTVLEAMAISPLKVKAKKGWTLLFIVALVNLAFSVLSNLIAFSIVGIVFAVLWAAVHGYFLFEIRSYFGAVVKADHKPAIKPKAKA